MKMQQEKFSNVCGFVCVREILIYRKKFDVCINLILQSNETPIWIKAERLTGLAAIKFSSWKMVFNGFGIYII